MRPGAVRGPLLNIRHSTFTIQRSPFNVHHSTFTIGPAHPRGFGTTRSCPTFAQHSHSTFAVQRSPSDPPTHGGSARRRRALRPSPVLPPSSLPFPLPPPP